MMDETPPRLKCLLVDDIEENLLVLAALLRREDVDLLQARSGPEALELLLVHDVALALLDVQMPRMDGFELAEVMRGSERTRNVPIIFVTAGARDQHRLFKGYETGAVDFLYKPIEAHMLQSKARVFFQLHRQKQQLARELQERSESLRLTEMLIAILGHDLRTPLTAILAGAEVLKRLGTDETQVRVAERVKSSATRMGRMIEDMLDLARARLAGGFPVRHERVDLGALVGRVVQEHLAASPERSIELQLEGDLTGEWDGGRMAQVVSNLVGNALQHGASDAPVTVRVDGTRPDGIVLSVGNAGSIAPGLLPHLFDPFRGGLRPSDRNDGLGLGLYIVEQIVQAHRGAVVHEAPDATRTVFRVEVPRRGPDGTWPTPPPV